MSDAPPKSLSSRPPQHAEHLITSYPGRHVLQLTLNRPNALNAMTVPLKTDILKVLDWFDNEPDLWVVVLTGAGRAFCAGQDLKNWNKEQSTGSNNEVEELLNWPTGFGSVARRRSSKPIIAAVNGHAFGGGLEMVLNCDLVVASEKALFGLPEVAVGVVAAAGGIPRLLRISGHQLASELLLTGKPISALDARDRFGFVNRVVPPGEVIPAALAFAQAIIAVSPDSVQATKRALNEASMTANLDEAVERSATSKESRAVYGGENIKEGLRAFNERRLPAWVNPKL